MRFRHGEATDVGQVRQVNEDGYLVAEPLFAVADGMGGHQAGEVASATALETLRMSVSELSADALMGGVEQANLEVFRRAAEDSALRGMGTTLCAIGPIVDGAGERIAIVNVGDSRIYLHTAAGLTQLTEDHSLVETMVRVGQLTPEQAAAHPKRNVVTRALGIEPTVDVDCWALTPAPGDRLLLCSDGLFGEVDDGTIAEVLTVESDPSVAAGELIRRANEAGGRDNITVLIVDVEPDGPAGATASPVEERLIRVSAPVDDLAVLGDSDEDVAVAPSPYLPPEPVAPPTPLLSRGTDRETAESPRQKTRGTPWMTWRVLLFVGVVLIVMGIAVGAVLLSDGGSPTPATATSTSAASTTSTTSASVTAPTTSTPGTTGVDSTAPEG